MVFIGWRLWTWDEVEKGSVPGMVGVGDAVRADARDGGSEGDQGLEKWMSSDLMAEFGVASENKSSEPRVSGVGASVAMGRYEIQEGRGGMKMVRLLHDPSSQVVEIYEFGATVTSWKVRNGEEMFFTSEQATFDRTKPIRAGIPICFPQFGPYGDLPTHGFARATDWKLKETTVLEDGSVNAVFQIDSSTTSPLIAQWGKSFTAEYNVILSYAGIETGLKVVNTGSEPLDFTMAFHNYFAVSDIANTFVFGLEACSFKDRLQGDAESVSKEDDGSGMILSKETDSIFMNTVEELAIFDSGTLKVYKIKKTPNLPDCTLWNPFGSKGADPGWRSFICLEPAAVASPVQLAPGEEWYGAQLLGVE
eukprot:CAMPEP_0184685258 /NCGR_PEP_ID=MMETSP0312-20130426/18261_1 /TAXON_ID=31354 /ORGANISM="Compsopogon coeruleus, Strain SAG 36.94" /LENGTH=363 /DNA_ID=CAMNT_0027139169 /DNA_START=173 /DNA_END=1265 /DNA_ORIENTATION=-